MSVRYGMKRKQTLRNPVSAYADFDNAWKEILDQNFPWFMKLFFPAVYEQIDWKRGYELLDKELHRITSKAKVGKRYVDKLIKVYIYGGKEVWVLIHIEIQSQRDANMPERMYIYNSAIFMLHKKPVMSIAVLGDDDPQWKPEPFESDVWGSYVKFHYHTIKLLDYRDKIEELKQSGNPYAFFVIAHLKTLETKRNPQERFNYKEALTKEMIKLGQPLETVQSIIKFIDIMMTLPDELEQEFLQRIYTYQEETNMPLLAPFEKIAMEKGRQEGWQDGRQVGKQEGWQEGRQEGWQEGKQEGWQEGIERGELREAQATLQDILEDRFAPLPDRLKEHIHNIEDISTVRNLRKQSLGAQSLQDFERLLHESISHKMG